MTDIHYRYDTVQGRRIFYRKAGPAGAPPVVLLHGFPTSSFMFRDLIPRLAGRYHVIAPDHLGLRAVGRARRVGLRLHLRRPGGADRRAAGTARPDPVRPGRPGLRVAGRLAARAARARGGHGGHHPERQRLRLGIRPPVMGADLGLPVRADTGNRGGAADPGRGPLPADGVAIALLHRARILGEGTGPDWLDTDTREAVGPRPPTARR